MCSKILMKKSYFNIPNISNYYLLVILYIIYSFITVLTNTILNFLGTECTYIKCKNIFIRKLTYM